jgi:hypothetical protein
MSRHHFLALVLGCSFMASPAVAAAGGVADQFRSGAFGLSWNADKNAIEAKYPGGPGTRPRSASTEYCAPSRQVLLKLPTQHQTKELCFMMGSDKTSAPPRRDSSRACLRCWRW